MKNKIIQSIPALLVLLAIGFRYFSLRCIFVTQVCYGTGIDHISLTVTKPGYLFSLFFLPLAIILIFISRQVFISWLKFAAVALPLAVLFIATTPVVDISILPFNRDDAARFAGQVFAVASLALIIWKWWSLCRKSAV